MREVEGNRGRTEKDEPDEFDSAQPVCTEPKQEERQHEHSRKYIGHNFGHVPRHWCEKCECDYESRGPQYRRCYAQSPHEEENQVG